MAGLLLAGCGSDLPPTPTEPTWSTGSTSATASTTVTPVSTVPTSTELAAGAETAVDVDLRRPRRTTTVARPRAITPTTTVAQRREVLRAVTDPGTAESTTTKTTTSKSATSKTTTPKASGKGYRSCAEAREAGAAPLLKGDAGYSSKLDQDDDGVACEV